jgi:predicted methyltransferase
MRATRFISVAIAASLIVLMACPRFKPKSVARTDKRGSNLNAYIAAELDSARDGWQKPGEVIEALSIRKGETVADVGAGAGYFTWRLAEAVGAEGTVYATETNVDLLTMLIKKGAEGGFPNVKVIEAQPDDPQLPYGSVDIALVCNNMSRVNYIYTFFDLLRRGLKTKGRLAVIDWSVKPGVGPDPSMRRKSEDVKRIVEGMGFRLVKRYDFLPHQYFMVFVLEEHYE